jgi:tetratricopeptide (TPR) repeat protein
MEALEKSKPCDWCSPEGVKGDGNGIFRDSDYDFSILSYPGIPVCGGCGGLGVQYDSQDFKERCERICTLRFKYHPTDSLAIDPPFILIYTNLKKLLEEVKELTEKYDSPSNSFARDFINDKRYEEGLKVLKETADQTLRNAIEAGKRPTEAEEESRKAIIKLYKGDVETGLDLYKKTVAKYPKNSVLLHDYGVILLTFERDSEKALECLVNATKLEPKKAMHFFQVATLLVLLDREEEAIKYLKETQKQSDYKKFSEQSHVKVGEILANLLGISICPN